MREVCLKLVQLAFALGPAFVFLQVPAGVQRKILKPCEIRDHHDRDLQPHKRLLAQFPTLATQAKVGVTGCGCVSPRVVNADGTLFYLPGVWLQTQDLSVQWLSVPERQVKCQVL